MELNVVIDPKEAATFLLNPSPIGKGDYHRDMVVTIDVLPKQGWQVDKWVGPMFNIDETTAQIQMDSTPSPNTHILLPSGIIWLGVENWVAKLADEA